VAIFTGSASIGTTSANLCLVPPGPCTVALSNNGTASPVWVGAGGTVVAGPASGVGSISAGNGFPLPSGAVSPMVFQGYQGSKGVQLVAAVTSGSATVGWIVSTATGQTGF
jgi:hypothetical protein